MSILVVGTVAYDAIKTPFGERPHILGGSATHFSVSASFFTDVRLMAVVGDDFKSESEQVLLDRGVDVTDLKRMPGRKTFFWKGEYGYDLNTAHTLDTQLNVLAEFDPQLDDSAREVPFLFLANTDPKLQRQARLQSAARLVALDTMNFWIEGARDGLLAALADIDLLVVNDAEARELAGESNLIRAARVIRGFGPKILVVKRGEFGAALFSDHGYFATPAYPIEEVIDPTGAGDSFAGGMMGYLAASNDTSDAGLRRAIIYGSVMASFNVEAFGCERLLSLTHTEIAERFRQFKTLTHFEEVEFNGRSVAGR
ncbi:MAG: sugar kinase [Blastocatellia bacterium]|nr:sugar kinase [Blastocatellia bacterium]